MSSRVSLPQAAQACVDYLRAMTTAYPEKFPRAEALYIQLEDALAAPIRRADDPPGEKYCAAPEHIGARSLPITAFSKSKGSPDGHQGYCKRCMVEIGRLHRDEETPR